MRLLCSQKITSMCIYPRPALKVTEKFSCLHFAAKDSENYTELYCELWTSWLLYWSIWSQAQTSLLSWHPTYFYEVVHTWHQRKHGCTRIDSGRRMEELRISLWLTEWKNLPAAKTQLSGWFQHVGCFLNRAPPFKFPKQLQMFLSNAATEEWKVGDCDGFGRVSNACREACRAEMGSVLANNWINWKQNQIW